MNKFVYWIGVYAICVCIHKGINATYDYVYEKGKRKEHESNDKKKGPIGIQPDSARKPMNKIGFAIPTD